MLFRSVYFRFVWWLYGAISSISRITPAKFQRQYPEPPAENHHTNRKSHPHAGQQTPAAPPNGVVEISLIGHKSRIHPKMSHRCTITRNNGQLLIQKMVETWIHLLCPDHSPVFAQCPRYLQGQSRIIDARSRCCRRRRGAESRRHRAPANRVCARPCGTPTEGDDPGRTSPDCHPAGGSSVCRPVCL